ncbi:hypothetical protein [Roseomonas xinghualingensis]|uniref:hypothetical protein n=1 Tax=Roseomonas xinghualingensis TaxID=2986475 RepID=UPI0021F106A3|nr:hypothetical protein [Roseomonas sp. SXEYE001]MCV4208859.1 hypothetical protein [Roseomonas sp. SXEYE001]
MTADQLDPEVWPAVACAIGIGLDGAIDLTARSSLALPAKARLPAMEGLISDRVGAQ